MSKSEMIKWLQNLKDDIGQTQHQDLWHYEKMLDRVIVALEDGEDCISREGVIKALRLEFPCVPLFKELRDQWLLKTEGYHKAEKLIEHAPSVVPSRAEGEWTNAGILTVHCSNCKSQFHELEAMNYCPNCGAKMKG